MFEPLRKPIHDRAAAFRKRLVETEPRHVAAVLEFAGRAYRRPLTDGESRELRSLYEQLRHQDIPHDAAIRLTLARVFVAPAFLYRIETPAAGAAQQPVSDWELATRLSYFLWSSQPDEELRRVAAAGQLRDLETLRTQSRRMLQDERVRRLANEFACQWLHIRDFDQLDEKSERHFPRLSACAERCTRSRFDSSPICFSTIARCSTSWTSPTSPSPLELHPALAFDRLFKDDVQRGDKSVLDAVLVDASDLRRQISKNNQRKLDEYLDSVRDVEQRIENAGKKGELQGWRPTFAKPNIPRPPDGIPQDIAEHIRLMCDILLLGFPTDTTRLTTLKLNNDHSSQRFPHLGVDYMIHHLLSHSDTENWLKVNQFFLEQLSYTARKLDTIQEGERIALDNSMLLYCSSMLTGHHDATQLPVVLLGRGGGQIQTGRVLDYRNQPNRQMCRLYLSLMDKMNLRLKKFGDATEPLTEV